MTNATVPTQAAVHPSVGAQLPTPVVNAGQDAPGTEEPRGARPRNPRGGSAGATLRKHRVGLGIGGAGSAFMGAAWLLRAGVLPDVRLGPVDAITASAVCTILAAVVGAIRALVLLWQHARDRQFLREEIRAIRIEKGFDSPQYELMIRSVLRREGDHKVADVPPPQRAAVG